MKRIITISLVTIVLVGGCSVILMLNRQKIEEKSKMDGNLDSIPVYVAEVRQTRLTGDFEVSGSFQPFHELTLMSEGQGRVIDLPVNTGDVVRAGQVIARLDDDLVKSQLSLAEAALEKSKADLRKFEGLLKADAISGQQVEDVRLALKKAETDVTTLRKQLDFATIEAPISGTVVKRHIEKGSLLMPGSPVADIVDISRLKFMAAVAETEVVSVTRGQEVRVTSTLFAGKEFSGRIVSVGVKADEARRFPVEIEISNPDGALKAGMFGSAFFGSGTEREAFMVPRSALVGSIRTPRIYVVENGRSVLRDVTIGSANDREVEITGGLQAGEKVVTAGQINLDNNKIVRIINVQ
mgnify:CR=1 FL=1